MTKQHGTGTWYRSIITMRIGIIRLLQVSALTILLVSKKSIAFSTTTFIPRRHVTDNIAKNIRTALTLTTTTKTTTKLQSTATNMVGPRIPINEDYPGIKRIYSNPDIFVIEDFLDRDSCQDIIDKAKEKSLQPSPVAYAGWTEDFKDLVELAVKGPVAWLALIGAWFQVKDDATTANQIDLVIHALQNYVAIFVLAVSAIGIFTYSRAESLKSLRTSTSTTLDDMSNPSSGPTKFVQNSAKLFGIPSSSSSKTTTTTTNDNKDYLKQEASLFEAPTVIRYEPDQVLAPHYDANRSAETEDANRGGQTLATLIVYLNDVEKGGLTRFGKLSAAAATTTTATTTMEGLSSSSNIDDGNVNETKLTIRPKVGDALLFFPADATGQFDERTEHEGCSAIDEKWIARIWKHKHRVVPPYGLSESALNAI